MDSPSEGLPCQAGLPSFGGSRECQRKLRPGHKKYLPLHQARLLTSRPFQTSVNSDSLSWGASNDRIASRGSGRNQLPCSPLSKKKDPSLNSLKLGPGRNVPGKRGDGFCSPAPRRPGLGLVSKGFYCPLSKDSRPQDRQSRGSNPSPFLVSWPEAASTSSGRTGASFKAGRNGKWGSRRKSSEAQRPSCLLHAPGESRDH